MAIHLQFVGPSANRIKPQKPLHFTLTSHFTSISMGAKMDSVAAKSASQTPIHG
jgi:hypothetical protein